MSEMKERDESLPTAGSDDLTDEATGMNTDEEDSLARQKDHEARRAYMIRIGQEIMLDGLKDCSFITTTYKMGDVIAGRIGVIGPRRMAYAKVVSNISFVRQSIDEQFRRLARGEDKREDLRT
jgi:heat-inducible transcriptional repressor